MKKSDINLTEINELKKNLMTKNPKKDNYSYTASISSEFYKMSNKKIGLNFEENIRNIFERKFGWEKSDINRKFLYTYIIQEEQKTLITDLEEKVIEINGHMINITINSDKSFELSIDGGESKRIKNQGIYKTKIFEKIIEIETIQDIEIDGIFDKFDFGKFDTKEVAFLFKKNINFSEYEKIVLESKLNKTKINELFAQIIRDREIMRQLTNEKILYLGVINSPAFYYEELKKFKEKNGDIPLVLIGIKNNMLSGLDIREFYDWQLREQVDIIQNEIKKMKEEIKNINTRLDNIDTNVGEIKKNFDEILPFLKRKRNRGKKK